MSGRSLQRSRDKGRGWSQQEREAYREEKRAKRFKAELRALKSAGRPKSIEIETPLDTDIVDI